MSRGVSLRSVGSLAVALVALVGGGCPGGEQPPGPAVRSVLLRPFSSMRALFILLDYEDDDGPLVTEEGANEHAAAVKAAFEANAYGQLSMSIDVTPVLTMPRPGSAYETGPSLVRLRADALSIAARAGFDTGAYDLEVIFGVVHWPTAASGIGALNNHTVFINRVGMLLAIRDEEPLPGTHYADFGRTEPPYRAQVDSTTLEDGVYALVAVATDVDGEVSTMLAPHIIDNTGPSDPR